MCTSFARDKIIMNTRRVHEDRKDCDDHYKVGVTQKKHSFLELCVFYCALVHFERHRHIYILHSAWITIVNNLNMSSPYIPSKRYLCYLLQTRKENKKKYKEIASYLYSPDYTRETKIESILYPRDKSESSVFSHICEGTTPMFIIKKVFDILGEEEISSPVYTD